ncbi:NAD(P)H-binding protein [Bradyrhizobium sp. USDA 3256]
MLQDSPKDSTSMVHHQGIANLFAACEQLKIRRVIHFSAIGVDRQTPSAFSETKLSGDKALMARDLDWIILRPSVVIGRAAYGASALMRGLAALPMLPVMRNTGQLQIVLLEDVVRTVQAFFTVRSAHTDSCRTGRPASPFFPRSHCIDPGLVPLASSARDPFAELCFDRNVQIR